MSSQPGSITHLLVAHRQGDPEALDQLLPLVHQRLERLARYQIRSLKPGQTLDTVALVNEAYIEMVDETAIEWQSRAHFFGITSRAMRRIVVDHLRRRFSQKRGAGKVSVDVDPDLLGVEDKAELILGVHRALEKLSFLEPRLVQVVECRFFVGMTEDEIAAALGTSVRTIQRDWKRARAWLQKTLAEASIGEGSEDS